MLISVVLGLVLLSLSEVPQQSQACNGETVANGSRSPDLTTYDYNTTVTYTCNEGYYHTAGDLTRTCGASSTWTGTLPTCSVIQCDRETVANGSLSPNQTEYAYKSTVTYTCNEGFNHTGGDLNRTCDGTARWNGTLPTCSVIQCDREPVVNGSPSPDFTKYDYNTTVKYTCNVGFNHTDGDLNRTCDATTRWTGTIPICSVSACVQENSEFTEITPDAIIHDFGENISYACSFGYIYTSGDRNRTCQTDGNWTGEKPVCSIITCDPPEAVLHASYTPIIHDWNTTITYSCDDGYHYVSGSNTSTCNESGMFPSVDLNCSVPHVLTVSDFEPAVTWLNETVTQIDTVFDYDGLCDVNISCIPDRFIVQQSVNGSRMIMTLQVENGTTTIDEYTCILYPFRGERMFPTVQRNVFYGDAIQEFQAWLVHDNVYVTVGETYRFEANATYGSRVNITWQLEENSSESFFFNESFRTMEFSHTFLSPTTNVEVFASNLVSNVSQIVTLYAIYELNGITFTVNQNERTTTETATFQLDIASSASIPMAETNLTFTLHNGTRDSAFTITENIHHVPLTCVYDVVYDVQGEYNVTVEIANPVSSLTLFHYMNIWDKLDNVTLSCFSNCFILKTETIMTVQFTGVLQSGFKYIIDMGDETILSNTSDSILYSLNNLSTFDQNYTAPDIYILQWSVFNGGYSRNGTVEVTVQNAITDFQVFLEYPIIYVVVGDLYNFSANGTKGTNVTIDWHMEDNRAETKVYQGEFTEDRITYSFKNPKTNVEVFASNLVSNVSQIVHLYAIYELNGITFTVNQNWRTTTETATFQLDIASSASIPMAETNLTFTLHNGTMDSAFTIMQNIQDVPWTFVYDVLYDVQGEYNVTVEIANPVSSLTLFQYMNIWDKLDNVTLSCFSNCFILITETIMTVQFTGVPRSGFKYIIDMGDETILSNTSDSILYSLNNSSTFDQNYTAPGIYILQWSVFNGGYSRNGTIEVTVQNAITDFQVFLEYPIIYVVVGDLYNFSANGTKGTNVTIDWHMEDNRAETKVYQGEFTEDRITYSFKNPKTNVEVFASNLVSNVSQIVHLYAIYELNGITFTVNQNWRTTTETATFQLDIASSASIPMAETNLTFTLHNGTMDSAFTIMQNIQDVPWTFVYDVLYDVQGEYNVTVEIANPVSSLTLFQYMNIWDKLDNVTLSCFSNCFILITETIMTVQFTGVPRSGFKYIIDMGDETILSNTSDSILYSLNNLSTFDQNYTAPGIYILQWSVFNGGYSNNGTIEVTVQDIITEFQVFLENPIIYVAVGDPYNFFANGTGGTNVKVEWQMEDNITLSNYFTGSFVEDKITYMFRKWKHNITVVATNLVDSQTRTVYVEAIYRLHNFTFNVINTLWNTTSPVQFDIHLLPTALVPMHEINISIDFKHGDNMTDNKTLGDFHPVGVQFSYNHLFDFPGLYTVDLIIENILGIDVHSISMRIWDSLLPLKLDFVNAMKVKYIATNATAEFNFTNVPNYGFQYTIDFGDNSLQNASAGNSILYDKYSLGMFTHVYTFEGVYILRWTAKNGEPSYDRDVSFPVHVQNKLPVENYTLEPIGLLYPWINLQSMDISVNISLEENVHIPTNATCVFDAKDGTSLVPNLTFASSFFEYMHRYMKEGIFNSTFNCSNDVSNEVYSYNLEVRKYQASYLSLVFHDYVPLNVSDKVTVYFHIDNGGFFLIPYQVYFSLDFDDGSSRSSYTYDKTTYTHVYSKRRNYTVNVKVYAAVTKTNNTLTYPLRLGLMYFEYNTTIQFINTTANRYLMYGEIGNVTYTMDFADGSAIESCNASVDGSCEIYHLCQEYGYTLVEVVASNGTFLEIDNINITCENPIVNLITDIPLIALIPNGTIDAKLRITENDLYLPKLFCEWNMGDPIKRKTYGPFSSDGPPPQMVTYEVPYLFTFQYIGLGRQKITIYCWNLINETNLEFNITVINNNFLFTGVFDRFYSQINSPMYISSMIDTEMFSRLKIVADYRTKTHTNRWLVNKSHEGTNRHGLMFSKGHFPEGKYLIELFVCFLEEPDNCIFEPNYVLYVMPPPHAEIVGSRRRYVETGSVVLDAASLSYDPVFPSNSNLTFSWTCQSYVATTFEDAMNKYLSGASASNCITSAISSGIETLTTSATPPNLHYVVSVTVDNNRGKSSTFTQVSAVTNQRSLHIICKINCLSKVAVSSKLQLIPNLTDNCVGTFSWTLKKKSTTYNTTINLADISYNGATQRSLTIRENTLESGTWYLVSVSATIGGIQYGPAYYEFVTNRPPQGGFCRIVPYNDTYFYPSGNELKNITQSATAFPIEAATDVFNCTCEKWADEGFTESNFTTTEPLFYLFYLKYSRDDTQRQLLYFDPGQTSNLVTFQAGDPDNGYKATIVLRIADIFGDYTELSYNIKSKPPLESSQLGGDANSKIFEFIGRFDDQLIKANRTFDYRTISRKVMDIFSVLNNLASNIKVLSPEELLSLDSQGSLDWSDLWSMIVEVDPGFSEYIIEAGERYAYMLNASVFTWPVTERMTLVAIETISRAFGAITAKMDYSNVTAAILAADSSMIMAQNLVNISYDRTFPNTWHLNTTARSILDVMRNCLAILQTVLAPNLPEDPTVDEMRNFLEYVKTFKTEQESKNSLLSLQEQTFLVQKQIQKYYLQKYIKTEASKRALPLIIHTLQNLTIVLGRMALIGQDEMFYENDYLYISVEKKPAYMLFEKTIRRPRFTMALNSLREDNPGVCSDSEIVLRTIVFKNNPYFWGDFAERISSYIPVLSIEGAKLEAEEITYRLENNVAASCVDQTPTYDDDDPDKLIYILFDRKHADDDLLIFVRPNTTELLYTLYFNKDEKPDIGKEIYSYSREMKRNDITWTWQDGYRVFIKATEYSETGKIWIGLKPLLGDSGDMSLLTRKFCATVTRVKCLAGNTSVNGDHSWDKDKCRVSSLSTHQETICICKNSGGNTPMTVGTTFYIPYTKIDFKPVVNTVEILGRTPVIGLMVACGILYILFVAWAWREDIKDQYKWSFSLLIDNDIADTHFYIVRVYTGLRSGAGTKSKIGFILIGEDGDTDIRVLDDDSHIGFERGSVRTFVMTTRHYLGKLISMMIWHDDTGGPEAPWFLNKATVTDLKSEHRYTFVCDQWFDSDNGDCRVVRVMNAKRYDNVHSFQELVAYTLFEHHAWISVLLRPIKSNFTRIQRLSCLLGNVYITMIISALLIKTRQQNETVSELTVGVFRFSFVNFTNSVIAVTLSTTITLVVSFIFKNSKSDNNSNIDSVFRRAYRKLNDKVHFDISAVAGKYWSPAEEAIKYNSILPHFCVYIGWTLLAIVIISSTYLMVMFSSDWQVVKSEEWMTGVLIAIICSFAVIEGFKVFIILLFFSLLCKRAYEPREPNIDLKSLEEITRYNSATLTIGPNFQSVLEKPENPNEEKLIQSRTKRMQNPQLLKIVYQLAMYGALLYLVYTISYESRDTRSFYLKDHLENQYKFAKNVSDLKSYTKWLKGTFKDAYFATTFFGVDYKPPDNETGTKSFMQDLTSFRVGPARLRQVRVVAEECLGPLSGGKECHDVYSESNKDTQNFCLEWKSLPCHVSEKSEYFTSPGWEFTSAEKVWGFPTVGAYCTYSGGGYFMTLDVNRLVSVKIFDELVAKSWFDAKTRAVILEFTIFNANTNLFVYSKYVAEFPVVGGFIPYLDIQVFRLFTHIGPNGQYMLYLEILFLLLVITASIKCIHSMCTEGKHFLKSLWNILDFVCLVMSYTTISLYIYKIFVIEKTLLKFAEDKNAYVGFENLAFYDFVSNTAYGVLVFLLTLRVSRILGYSGKINEMAGVISNAASDMFGFILIFGIVSFAYVALGTLLFGKDQATYKDVFETYSTITLAILGNNKLTDIMITKPGFAEVYYVTFVLFVLWALMTMASAILNFSITKVKEETRKAAPTNIVEVIVGRIIGLLSKLSSAHETYGGGRKEMKRRGSDPELNEILDDFGAFIRDFKLNRIVKVGSTYRLK